MDCREMFLNYTCVDSMDESELLMLTFAARELDVRFLQVTKVNVKSEIA